MSANKIERIFVLTTQTCLVILLLLKIDLSN